MQAGDAFVRVGVPGRGGSARVPDAVPLLDAHWLPHGHAARRGGVGAAHHAQAAVGCVGAAHPLAGCGLPRTGWPAASQAGCAALRRVSASAGALQCRPASVALARQCRPARGDGAVAVSICMGAVRMARRPRTRRSGAGGSLGGVSAHRDRKHLSWDRTADSSIAGIELAHRFAWIHQQQALHNASRPDWAKTVEAAIELGEHSLARWPHLSGTLTATLHELRAVREYAAFGAPLWPPVPAYSASSPAQTSSIRTPTGSEVALHPSGWLHWASDDANVSLAAQMAADNPWCEPELHSAPLRDELRTAPVLVYMDEANRAS
ncbi:hypothetical protein L1887_54234 [Cichorium endivia]|nr:hypothetical protein L1887_54234 [Cichorium endivia]